MHERDEAYLLVTHFLSEHISKEFDKLERASRGRGAAWMLLQGAGTGADLRVPSSTFFPFSFEEGVATGYTTIGNALIPGHNHFAVHQFVRAHPEYRYYWYIEYDVRFTGDWAKLFKAFRNSDADLLTCHVRIQVEQPHWQWWDLSHPREFIPLDQRVRSFNPIFRLSRRAAAFLHYAQRDGWRGHSEVLIPTLLHRNGFKVVDFGGVGRFVPAGQENKFYLDVNDPYGKLIKGTMACRPVVRKKVGPHKNKLYHPVKPEQFGK